MGKAMIKRLKESKGFTLIEMIITITIITTLSGLVIAGITGYATTAYMNRVNETAKTVFFATQNYLTREKQLGNLSEINDNAKSYGSEVSDATLEQIFKAQDPNFDFNAYKEKYSTSSIRYILLNKGQGTKESSNPIYTIVNTYIEDKELLENTFLIEYDSKSGVVRSVFYTEKADTFTYDGDQTTRQNVMLRDSKSLRRKRQGYYGVDTTSLAKYNIDIDSPSEVMLINDERLYLQWKESNLTSTNPSLNQDLIYKVEVYREKDSEDELLFTIDDIKASDSYYTSLVSAQAKRNDNKVVVSYKDDTYQLMFDSVHNSIFDLFYGSEKSDQIKINENDSIEQLSATDVIYCTVSVHLNDNTEYQGESLPAVSNLQSSNYGGGDESITFPGTTTTVSVGGNGNLEEDGTSEKDGTAFSVYNARHLNNMRNTINTACFVQRNSIDWATSQEDVNEGLLNENFEPVSFKDLQGSSIKQDLETETIYKGTYRVAKNSAENEAYKISNIKIRKNTNNSVGIFKENMGSISGIYLEKSSISGGYTVGAIAGSNGYKGIIKDITLDSCEVSGGFYVGGVVGRNIENAEILNIKSKSNVFANTKLEVVDLENNASLGQFIGGIVGANSGSIKDATTAIVESSTVGTGSISGLKDVGGIVGENRGKNAKIDDSLNYNKIIVLDEKAKDLANFGGIAGSNDEQGTISNSSNVSEIAIELEGYNTLRAQDSVENIGGIVGRNNSTVKNSSYKIEQESKKTEFSENLLTKIKKNVMPQYFGVNVGGLIGLNEKNGVVSDCTSNGIVAGYRVVGGAVGYNKGSYAHITSFVGRILSVFNTKMTQVEGLVVASDQLAGGIFGANEGASITNLTNNANVFAKSGAGGIVGVNGAYGTFTELNVENESYYNNLINPSFTNGTTNNSATISNCNNTGFVYALKAYAGGISGINTGTIKKSNSVVRSLEMFTSQDYKVLANADCVGGIVGLNTGTITGDSSKTTSTQVYGKDFIGAIVGLNKGEVSNYKKAEGEVYSSGQAVGGTIGLNWNSKTLSDNTVNNDKLTIYGEYFVGGAFGCNVTSESSQETSFEKTTIGSGVKIEATAYVGGIVGYQTSIGNDSFQDVMKDLENQNKKAFEVYNNTTQASPDAGLSSTVFKDCENKATVIGKRYVGGIIGYNSNNSNLYVTKSNNYGAISINTTDNKTTDDHYLIGGITGLNSVGGVIDQCINDGAVKSPSKYLGGISEINEGYIQFCVVGSSKNYTQDTEITGEYSVGGIVGLNNKYVVHCTTSVYAVIRGGNNTGGLVGTNGINGVITGDGSKISPVFGSNNGDNSGTVVAGSVIGKNNTGGIVGFNEGSVEQVSIKDSQVSGAINVGGFIGYNGATGSITPGTSATIGVIKDLTNNAKLVVGAHMVGGIVGAHEASMIDNCTNQGTVRATGNISTSSVATGYAGGITGYIGNGVTIKNSKNEGTVESNYSQAGGIAANNEGTVEDCTNIGNVYGSRVASENSAIGGIVGINERTGKVKESNSIKNTDETNKIDGNYIVGGLVGYNKGEISNAQDLEKNVTINITVTKSIVSGIKDSKYPHIGGIIGKVEETNDSTLKNFIFSGTIRVDANASQENYIGGIIGRLPQKMTLENCIFDGTILGEGNGYAIDSSSNKTGVGGIAGYSAGTIVAYEKEIDGNTVYTSNTKKSKVEGVSNVGGLVGIINNTHTIKLKINGSDELITNTSNYYTNYTQVRGVERVGGFYGQTDVKAAVTISKLINEATILPNTSVSGNVNKSKQPVGFGGILGSSWAEASSANSVYPIFIESCINKGNFGIENTTYGNITAIGGILGSGHNNIHKNTSKYESLNNVLNCENFGTFYYGTAQIGGIVGRIKYGTIENSTNYSDITRSTVNYAGGIVGEVTAGDSSKKTILRSVNNKGNIKTKGGNYIGGILGGSTYVEYYYAQIEGNSSNTGTIEINSSAKTIMIGGIVGNGAKVSIIGTKETPIINKGTINIKNSALGNVGGIAGYIEEGNVEYVNNEGEIKLHNSSGNSQAFEHIGGIIGRTWLPVKVNNCNNTGKITINQALYIGGIIGSTEGTVEVSNCTNQEIIDVEQGLYIGGIVGCINKNTSGIKIKNCTNNEISIISGFSRFVGGIVGGIHQSIQNLNTAEIDACTNYAKIEGREYVGGIIGNFAADSKTNGTQTLINSRNEGDILGQLNGNNETVSYIGGIIGYANGEAEMNSFDNTGNITIDTTQTTLHRDNNIVVQDIGGIVGYFAAGDQSESRILNATNSGSITFELSNSHLATNVVRVGGIAGSVSSDSKIEYCINKASVIAPEEKSSDIGGITGKNQGLLYSNVTEKGVEVQGYENVGGIAGSTIGIKSKITSVVKGTDLDNTNRAMNDLVRDNTTTEYTITQNNADVFGTKKVGGIVGYSQVATIQTVLNTGAVELGKSSTLDKTTSAGGIVGNSEFLENSTIKGVIANAYNFGEVKFAKLSGQRYYLGGLLGYRDWNGTSASTSIKDSFYYDNNSINSSQPNADISPAVLAIGSEPEEEYHVDPQDQDRGAGKQEDLEKPERYKWSNEAYIDLYKIYTGADDLPSGSWENVPDVINNIIKIYNQHKLPVPITNPVVAGEQYLYTLPIEEMSGFVEELVVKVYESESDLNDGKPSLLTISQKVTMDGKTSSINFDLKNVQNYEKYIGKALYVSIQAKGVSEDDIIFTLESDEKIVQSFVMMPQLPAIEVKYLYDDNTKVTFEISNWSSYLKAASKTYSNLNLEFTLKDQTKLSELEIYEAIKNGLDKIYISDKYSNSENGSAKHTKIWEIKASDINDDGIFVIDYSKDPKFESNKVSNQYHSWEVQAIANNSSDPVDATSVMANNDLYRYTNSHYSYLKYRIVQKTKLAAPTNITSKYKGITNWDSMNASESAYEVSFTKSSSNASNIEKYVINIYGENNNKITKELNSSNAATIILTKQEILDLGVSVDANSSTNYLKVDVQAMVSNSGKDMFFNSDITTKTQAVTIIKKREAMNEGSISAEQQNPFSEPNKIYFSWTYDSLNSNTFIYSYEELKKNTEEWDTNLAKGTGDTSDKSITLEIKDVNNFMELKIKLQGEVTNGNITSLDSQSISHRWSIVPALDKVSDISTTIDRVDDKYIYYNITFNKPTTLTNENCSEFEIRATSATTGSVDSVLTSSTIDFDTSLPVEIKIPKTTTSRSFYIRINALSKNTSQFVNSGFKESDSSISIPTNSLEKPTIEVPMFVFDDDTSTNLDNENEVELSKYKTGKYLFEFGSFVQNSSAQKVEIRYVDDEDNETVVEQVNIDSITQGSLELDPEKLAEYSGKKLILMVRNIPENQNQFLPSEDTLEFYVPKIINDPVINKAELVSSLDNIIADLTMDNFELSKTDLEESNFNISWDTQDYEFVTQKIQLIYVDKMDETIETVLYEDSSTLNDGTTQTRNFTMTKLGNSDGSNDEAWEAYEGKDLVLRITQVIKYSSDTSTVEISNSSDHSIYIPKIQ